MTLNKVFRGVLKYVFNSDYRFLFRATRRKYDSMPDEEYLKKMFKIKMGYCLDLDTPETFNQKLNWMKLYYRDPLFTTMVDKYAVREYVSSKIGKQYLVPLLGVWDNPENIDISILPNKFVLKTTHGCGGMSICRDKEHYDIKTVVTDFKKNMSNNYYYYVREWPYKDVKPRVIAEKYLQNGESINLQVYKVFNFNGYPKIIQMISNDKTKDETIDYFDTEWNRLDLRQNYPNSVIIPPKPHTLNEMLELSAKCSEGFPFLRTDWYEVDGKVYFSEFTFYSDGGMEPFTPTYWDKKLGELIELPKVK